MQTRSRNEPTENKQTKKKTDEKRNLETTCREKKHLSQTGLKVCPDPQSHLPANTFSRVNEKKTDIAVFASTVW